MACSVYGAVIAPSLSTLAVSIPSRQALAVQAVHAMGNSYPSTISGTDVQACSVLHCLKNVFPIPITSKNFVHIAFANKQNFLFDLPILGYCPGASGC